MHNLSIPFQIHTILAYYLVISGRILFCTFKIFLNVIKNLFRYFAGSAVIKIGPKCEEKALYKWGNSHGNWIFPMQMLYIFFLLIPGSLGVFKF